MTPDRSEVVAALRRYQRQNGPLPIANRTARPSYAEPMTPLQQEPVAINGIVAIILAVITPILVKAGLNADSAAQVIQIGVGIVTGILALAAVFRARSKVTPVAPPPPH